jgi:general secretion pathway protein H
MAAKETMPILATGNKGQQGFTLVELMVVLVIVGLMSAVVMISLPDPRGRLTDEAERFAARALAARDLAIVSARPVRLRADPSGYAFDQRRDGTWVVMSEKPFRPEPWGQGIAVSPQTAIVFDPTGIADPQAQLILERENSRASILISGNGAIRVGG